MAVEVARRIDFGLLLMLSGAIWATLSHPFNLTFIQLPTDLHELVLFDTAMRRSRDQTEAFERNYRRRGSGSSGVLRSSTA